MNNSFSEFHHSVLGVSGRMLPRQTRLDGTLFSAQKWVSESRPIRGFGKNGKMSVEIRFDDECRNGHATFSVTASVYTDESRRHRDVAACGAMHDDIAKVFPELARLIRWHLCDTRGPWGYVANTVFHADQHGATHAWVYFTGPCDPLQIGGSKERLIGYEKASLAKVAEGQPGYRVQWDEKTIKVANFDHARSSACWPEATDAELSVPKAELESALMARLPALMDAMRADMQAAGFAWSPAELAEEV